MNKSPSLAQQVIVLLQDYITAIGYKPVIHFELEGCYQLSNTNDAHSLNFSSINKQLAALNIDGELVPEYWKNQWEYVSKFNGQTPLKEAENLAAAMKNLPAILAKHGVTKTLIQPVVWSGDQGKLASGSANIFSQDNRVVHIPNAIQINVSAFDDQGDNIVAKGFFGEYLQQCFIQSSYANCLLYLPEEDAFERLALKSRYGLAQELCSPVDISGGHQGSIALYKELGKHNQHMGEEALLVDQHNQPLLSHINWQKTARIEHRLGASSHRYDPFINIIYALLNLIDALKVYQQGRCQQSLIEIPTTQLPESLHDNEDNLGAISLFAHDQWFHQGINAIQEKQQDFVQKNNFPDKLGDRLKHDLLSRYRVTTDLVI